MEKKIRVVTHNGNFHADDAFACATLTLWAEKNGREIEITRSRDRKIIDSADIVVDVGDEYDEEKNRFDHHQRGGAGTHLNNIPYASFGLVWKKYGEEVCESREIAEIIERKLVVPIDARDNGVNLSKNLIDGISEYGMFQLFVSWRPSWQDASPENNLKKFLEFMDFAKTVIRNEIYHANATLVGEEKVREEIVDQKEPEILILKEDLPWENIVTKFKKIMLVVYPEPDTNQFCIEVTRDDLSDYASNRISFPESWRGAKNTELENISGVSGAIFCHRGGFFAVASTLAVALEIAKKTLQSAKN